MADAARIGKVQDRIKTTVAKLLERRIKDPRLGFVTITDCRVTGDLQHATVFYTVLNQKDLKKTERALKSATGLIRSEVGKALGIRLTPTIEFVPDKLPEQAANFEELLKATRDRDRELAESAASKEFAGGQDPYRKPREEADDDDQLIATAFEGAGVEVMAIDEERLEVGAEEVTETIVTAVAREVVDSPDELAG